MSWLSNLFTSKDKKVEQMFMGGMDAFATKDFPLAYRNFLKAYTMTKSKKIKLNCLINASNSAENLNNNKDASKLLVQAAKLRASMNEPVKDVTETLEKAYSLILKDDLEEFGEVIGPLMILKIATQDYSFAKRLNRKILNLKPSNELNRFALEVYNTLIKDPEIVWSQGNNFIKFPSSFPNEFKNYVKTIQEVIRNSVALTTEISSSKPQLKAGESLQINVELRNYTPMTISSVFINSGSKGTVSREPDLQFPKNLPSKEKLNFSFDLTPQLTGQWQIGPIVVNYMIAGKNYEYKSDLIVVEVLEGEKQVDISLEKAEIEEDFEYEITGKIVNTGNSDLENIKLILKVPSEAKISLGTVEKKIFELRKGESFKFTNNVKFEAGTLGKEFKIKAKVELDGGVFEKELKISGTSESQ